MSRLDSYRLTKSKSLSRFKYPLPSENNEISKTSKYLPTVTPTSSVAHIKQTKTILPKPKTQPKPPPPQPDVPMVEKAKKLIDELIQLIINICQKNDTTPEIEEDFKPSMTSVQKSLPEFYRQSLNYFATLKKLQDSAKQNMILSSALVKKPFIQFSQDWKSFSETIEKLYVEKPPPQGRHITMNFLSISHTLDSILKVNNQRIHPCTTLSETCLSIQSLCDKLNESIINLFSQPTFPNFETDLLSTYKHDVKAFLRILSKAFVSEFPKNGIQIYDLMCIKSDVFAQVSEILSSLESAFTFQSVLEKAILIRNEINSLLTVIFDQLSIDFFVVKPNPEMLEKIQKENELLEKKLQTEKKVVVKKTIEKNYITAFAQNVSPKIGVEVHRDNQKNLQLIEERIFQILEKVELQKNEIQRLRDRINQMDSYEELYKTQSETYNSMMSQKKSEIQMKDKQIQGFDSQIDELKEKINKKNETIYSIQCQVCDLRDVLANKLGKPVLDQSPQSAIPDMSTMLDSLDSIKESQIQVIEKNKEFNEILDFLKAITNTDSESLIEQGKVIEKIIQEQKDEIIHLKETIEIEKKNNEQKVVELNEKIENEKIQSASNLQLQNESNKESIDSFISQLKPILDGNEMNTFDEVIHSISNKINELNSKIIEKEEKLKEKSRKKKELKSLLIESYEFPKDWSFRVVVQQIINTKNLMRNIPAELQQKMDDQEERIKTLYTRLLGIAKLNIQSYPEGEFEVNSMMNSMFQIIDKVQDDVELCSKDSAFLKTAKILRNCIESLEQRLGLYLGRKKKEAKTLTNEELMDRINHYIDSILDPDFNSQFMKVNEIKSYFKQLRVDSSALPSEYIPAFCKVFDQMEQSLDVLPQFGQILKAIFDSLFAEENCQSHMKDEVFAGVEEQVELLQSTLNQINEDDVDSNLFYVLSNFVQLSHILITRITKSIFT